jgi:aspartate-semialdehyde dehydrogenase
MKVAVVGATGLVGSKMLQILAERNFPVSELIPVASEKSVGKLIVFNGKNCKVVGMADAIALKPNVALFSAVEVHRLNGLKICQKQELPL